MLVRDIVVALDWSAECHGLKVSWPGRTALLLSDHEIDDGNDFYPKNEGAPETGLAEAEERMDAISACEVGSMRVEGGYLVIELEHGSVPKFPDGNEKPRRWQVICGGR